MKHRRHGTTRETVSKCSVRARGGGLFAPAIVAVCAALLMPVAAVAGAETTLEVNPYAGIEWEQAGQFKMNLHTHTTQSDGRMPPDEVIDEYHSRGYDALAITDHDMSIWPWTDFGRDPAELGMVAIPGNELSRHHHTLSLFTQFETEERDHDAALEGVAEAGGLAILCHPAMHWLREYASGPGLQVPLTPALRAVTRGDFTIETWFRTTDPNRNIPVGNYSSRYPGALNLELHTNNRVRLFVQPSGDAATVDINVPVSGFGINTRDGEWHHLAGVRRNNQVFLYLDGQLVGQRADTADSFLLQGDSLFIGRDTRTGSTTFNGDLSTTRLWNRALSENEIAASVSGGSLSTDGLLAEYAFAEDSGETGQTVFADTAGHADGPFHASVVGSVSPPRLADGPEALAEGEQAPGALRFAETEPPGTVPDVVAERYIALFERHPHLVATEVLNRTRPDGEYPLDRALWDRLLTALMPERPVWGVAVDDMHSMSHLGGDWVVAPAPELDIEIARAALTNGAFYFASTRLHDRDSADVARTPRIERVEHDPDTNHIVITATVAGEPLPDNAYVWISDGREIHRGPSLPYRSVAGLGVYARAEITGDGGTAYTNPFGFRR